MPAPTPVTFSVRLTMYVAAVAFIGLGVALMVRAELGVPPNDVMNTGLADLLGIGVGSASWITAAIAMVIALLLGRRPRVATVLGGLVVGVSINASLALLPAATHLAGRTLMVVAGLVVIWVGLTVVVATDVGAGALELIMLALVDRNVGLRVARWGIESVLLAIGLLLGGEVGLGTVAFVLGTGPVLAITLPPAVALLGTSLHRRGELETVATASGEGGDHGGEHRRHYQGGQ